MALQIVEFFGLKPLDPAARGNAAARHCPFIAAECVKPNHGACAVNQLDGDPIICCPNRLYANNYRVLKDIADFLFGEDRILVAGNALPGVIAAGKLTGKEIAVFGRYWGREVPLPRPAKKGSNETSNYFVDWILARLDSKGELAEFTAVEVQTIDTTGSYKDQASLYFENKPFTDPQGRTPGFSESGMNWENVNKRILPQLIYKGHVLRREAKCSKGLFFVGPRQVLRKIRDRLGDNMHEYVPGNGTITFRSYELGPEQAPGVHRDIVFVDQFTTTVDQVALAFTSPMNLPKMGVYEAAISQALKGQSGGQPQLL